MLIVIASIIAIIYALLKPLSDGLVDTSMWVTKVLAPSDFEDNASTKQFMKIGQAALMQGWLGNIPFITTTLHLSAIIISFFYSWWAGILMFLILSFIGVLSKMFLFGSVATYLPYLYSKMVNVAVDCNKKKDVERSVAAESFCKDLKNLISIYQDSPVKPPTPKELKEIPYGDIYYLVLKS